MRAHFKRLAIALVFAGLVAPRAQAASVVFALDLSVPGQFTLTARTTGDNAGLAYYNVRLLGNVISADNRSPAGTDLANFSPMGFWLLRKGDSGPLANPEFRGSQDTQGPIANLVYGFGQQANSWVGLGKTNLGAADTTRDEAWSVPLRIAVGTYTGSLRIDDNNPDFSANVFTSQGQPQTQLASVYDASFGYQIMIDNVNANDPGLVTRNFADFFPGPPPNQFWQFRGPTLVHPATFDQTTREFRWNTTGAILGEYSWHTAYLTDQGDWDPHVDITVRITAVPESATFSLLTLAGFGSFVLIRRVRAEG